MVPTSPGLVFPTRRLEKKCPGLVILMSRTIQYATAAVKESVTITRGSVKGVTGSHQPFTTVSENSKPIARNNEKTVNQNQEKSHLLAKPAVKGWKSKYSHA